METNLTVGKFFDMLGYDGLATVQSVGDEMVRYAVLTNNSSHILLAEMHAMSEGDNEMQDPGKLVASFPYGPFEHGWRVAYKAALAEAVRLAHVGDDSCPGCGCKPGDGVTEGCTNADGCGYFAAAAPSRSELSKIAVNADPRD